MTATTANEATSTGKTAANHQAREGRLGIVTLGVYGSGALVQDVAAFALNNLLLFYLTIVCGLSGSMAGLAVGITLVADSFVDPLVGSLSDNSRSRHGRRHPWMAASILPLVIGFGLLFSVPPGLTGVALFAYGLATLLVVRVGISGFQVPYFALGAELSDDYAERSSIVAARVVFTVLATVLGAFLAYGVFMRGVGGQTHRDAYPPFAWTCGALMLLGAAVSTLGTLRARDRLHAATAAQGGARSGLFAEVIEVLRNRSFRILFTACLVLFIALGAATSLTLHANTYFWKLPTSAILVITLAYTGGLLSGVFVAGALSRAWEKRYLAMAGIGLIGLSEFLPATLRVAGLIPGVGAAEILLMAAAALGGLGASFALIGFQSMMADAADEHEYLFGARREGLYFAGINLAAKASSGIGSLIAGVILDLIGFPHGVSVGSHLTLAAIPAHSIRDLGLAYGPGASILTATSVIVLTAYRRGRRDQEQVRDALLKRRGEVHAAGE